MPNSPKASPEQLDKIGQLAADMVNDGDHVGLGSGRAALAFVRALGKRIADGKVRAIGIPTSLLTARVASESGIPLSTLEQTAALDIAVDGADEVDPQLNLLKGGGGNLTREKVIASISKKLVIVVGEEKLVPSLGTKFPVFLEVIEFARPVITRHLENLGASVKQRLNPDGSPFLTDNANPYLEATFPASAPVLRDPAQLDHSLHQLPGLVETGLFIHMAQEIIVARFDNTIQRQMQK